MTARFITAPDKLPIPDPEESHTKVLIVDTDWSDIESIAFLCMTKQVKYDFYLFGPTSIDLKWLDHAAEEAEFILINGATTGRHLDVKAELSKLDKAIILGEGNILKLPMDFIVKQLEEE
jgi:hypothetical protein